MPIKLLLAFSLLWAAGLHGQSTVWNAREIRWTEVNPDGTTHAVLDGDRSGPGVFSYAFFMPNGTWYSARSTAELRAFWSSLEPSCLEMARFSIHRRHEPFRLEDFSWSRRAPNTGKVHVATPSSSA